MSLGHHPSEFLPYPGPGKRDSLPAWIEECCTYYRVLNLTHMHHSTLINNLAANGNSSHGYSDCCGAIVAGSPRKLMFICTALVPLAG